MTHLVFCTRLKKELPGLEAPPFPGPRGQEIYTNVSQQAWTAWQEQQTMLINEHQLNMMDKDARRYLNEQMDRYFAGEELTKADGYIPPEPKG
jgi:Fe-S cluster biosynthesis and repair protein YggX|tara:strand:- start:173 stop:451 length:279 start_codon:yes stop_codon:yes gene_type:complete